MSRLQVAEKQARLTLFYSPYSILLHAGLNRHAIRLCNLKIPQDILSGEVKII
jgi:hypothetical protein